MRKMVSVIIVSYNTKNLTLKCLEALNKSAGRPFEVIVVDNASTDGSVKEIKERFQDIKIIKNSKNKGFGTAQNQGMKIATGEYLLLLNSDCFVEKNTIPKLTESINWDVAGCKLLNSDGSIQQSWGYFPTLRRVTQMMLFIDNLPFVRDFIDSIHVRSIKRYGKPHDVDWVTAALMLIKREVYEKTGGFDEKFFMYGEEIEWQFRIKKLGFKIRYNSEVTATHLIGASSPNRAPAVVGEIEGWKYWFFKHHHGWQETALRVVVYGGCLLRIVLKPQWAKYYKEALVMIWKKGVFSDRSK